MLLAIVLSASEIRAMGWADFSSLLSGIVLEMCVRIASEPCRYYSAW